MPAQLGQAPIYVIVNSLLELSFCTQPFPIPSGWLCRCVLTLVMALWRSINFVLLLLLFLTLGRSELDMGPFLLTQSNPKIAVIKANS